MTKSKVNLWTQTTDSYPTSNLEFKPWYPTHPIFM